MSLWLSHHTYMSLWIHGTEGVQETGSAFITSSDRSTVVCSSPAGAFTAHMTRAPIGSVLPAGTVAQRFGRGPLVVVLHLLSNPACRR